MEAQQIQKHLERIAEEAKGNTEAMKSEVASLKAANQDLIEKHDGLRSMFLEFEQNELTRMSGRRHSAPQSIAAQVAKSDGFSAFKSGDSRSFRIRLETSIDAVKNLTSTQNSPNSPADGYQVHPQRMDGITNYGIRPLTVVDAMTRMQVSSNTFEHVRINDDYVDQANYQTTEGANKAEQSIDPTLATSNIATIAVTLPVAKQVLDDVPALQMSLSQILGHGVMKRLEQELMNGAGGAGQILGLASIADAAVVDSPAGSITESINDQIADLQAAGWNPNGILMNPRTWAAIRNQQDSSVYLLGPPGSSVGNTLWSMPVIVSPVVAEDDFFVGDWGQALLLDRQSLTIEAFEQHEDFARRNLVLMRAELRAGLAVPSPSAFRYFNAA